MLARHRYGPSAQLPACLADSITEKQINPNTAEKKAGKVTVSARRTVSKDGKTLTVHEKGTDEAGTKLDDTLIYKKQ